MRNAVVSKSLTRPDPTPKVAAAGVVQFNGTLAIDSDPPGAAVLVDQRPVGETMVISRSRAGSHLVWIERAGYIRWTSRVKLWRPVDQHRDVIRKLEMSDAIITGNLIPPR